MRRVEIEPDWLKNPLGSVMVTMGDTRVLCTANTEDRVPPFLVGKGQGWVTAEYAMIPGATNTRSQREASKGRQSGRTLEIQRLIGRALRSVVDRQVLGERTLWVDCDVLQADGGTRTAAITGGFVALCLALSRMRKANNGRGPVLSGMIAAISVGVVGGQPALDLDYAEDSTADVDMNVVRTDDGRYVEVQGTAEAKPFRREQLDALLGLADAGIDRLHLLQREVLGSALDGLIAPRR
jgi:ribonuclease PH